MNSSLLRKEANFTLQEHYDACHAELLEIHRICLCIAECPPPELGKDTLTVYVVKCMAQEINRLHNKEII